MILITHIIFDLPTQRDEQQPIEKNSQYLDLRQNRKSQKFSKGAFW